MSKCIICGKPTNHQGEEYHEKMCPDCKKVYEIQWAKKEQVEDIISRYQRGLITPLDVIEKCCQLY